jgi:hypothetical protein
MEEIQPADFRIPPTFKLYRCLQDIQLIFVILDVSGAVRIRGKDLGETLKNISKPIPMRMFFFFGVGKHRARKSPAKK